MIDIANSLLLPDYSFPGSALYDVFRGATKTIDTARRAGVEGASEVRMPRLTSLRTTAVFCLCLIAAAVALRVHLERNRYPAPPVTAYIQPHHH